MDIVLYKFCKRCNQTKSGDEFYKNKIGSQGLSHQCKDCLRKLQKESRERNIEVYKERERLAKQKRKLRNPDEWNMYIRECHRKQRERNKALGRKPKRSPNERNSYLKEYGITDEKYKEMLDGQGGVCAICRQGQIEKRKYFSIDHDHATGKIRGLLCNRCNSGLGFFKDSLENLSSAMDYLKSRK